MTDDYDSNADAYRSWEVGIAALHKRYLLNGIINNLDGVKDCIDNGEYLAAIDLLDLAISHTRLLQWIT